MVPDTLEVGDRPTDAGTGAHSNSECAVRCTTVRKRGSCPTRGKKCHKCQKMSHFGAMLSVYTRCQPISCKAVTELHRRTIGKWNRALFSWSSRPRECAEIFMASYTKCMWTRHFV